MPDSTEIMYGDFRTQANESAYIRISAKFVENARILAEAHLQENSPLGIAARYIWSVLEEPYP